MREIYSDKNSLFVGNRSDFLENYRNELFFNLSVTDELFYKSKPNKKEVSDGVSFRKNYITVNWRDFGNSDSYYLGDYELKNFNLIFKILKQELMKRDVIINCTYGVSRSSSTAFLFLKYLGYFGNKSFNKAFSEFQRIYPLASPNPGIKIWIEQVYLRI